MTFPNLGLPYPVPRTATPVSHAELAGYFVAGHIVSRGKRPGSRELLYTAAGIIGVENADGRAIIQHNWGNVSANLASYRGPFWLSPVAGQANQPIAFRAFDGHVSGAAAWWDLMYGSFRRVLQAAALGDSARMVAELYATHYVVGGSPAAYAAGAAHCSAGYRSEALFAGFYRSDVAAAALTVASVAGIAAIGVLYA